MGVVATRLTAVVFCLYLLFGQRLTYGATTGGRGTVSVLELAFVALAAGMWVVSSSAGIRQRPPRVFSVTVGPLFALLVMLPILGVILEGYELRTLYTVVVVVVPIAVLALGATATQVLGRRPAAGVRRDRRARLVRTGSAALPKWDHVLLCVELGSHLG